LVRAEIRLEEEKEEAAKKRAVDEWIIKEEKEKREKKHAIDDAIRDEHEKEEKEKREKKHLLDDAIRDEHEKEEKEKKREREAKKKWASEEAARKKKEEEDEKKKEKEIEDEMRHRMAKSGYHNEDIEAVVTAKNVHYCHEHHVPYPCLICSTNEASPPSRPIYNKVRRDLICTDTLSFYSLPWRYDPVSA